MRPLVALLPLALVLAGCIAPPEDEDVRPAAAPPPVADRIDGMTARETKQDQDVDCGGSPGFCAERDLLVEGRIGEDELPVQLDATNGAITLTAGAGDAWSLHAVYRVRAASQADAREGLDTAWRWTHEEGGQHVLKAGPAPAPLPLDLPIPLPGGAAATLVSAHYEVVLPAWVLLDVTAHTSNGPITVVGLRTTSVQVDTSNGPIVLEGYVQDAKAATSNGDIDAIVKPTASGSLAFETSNGAVTLGLVEDAAHGYDLSARTSNGRVTILLQDGEVREERDRAEFRTRGYDARDVQSTVDVATSNGAITVTG